MILQGDTIQLKVHFKKFDGSLVDPTNITLTTYNSSEVLLEQVNILPTNKESTGIYFYNYVVPSDNKEIIYEFKGTYDSNPILVRNKFKVQFTK